MIGFSLIHISVFFVVALLLFGNRLPSVARSIGRSLVEFKKGMNAFESKYRSSLYSQPTYEKSFDSERIEPKLSPLYGPAIRFGVIVQSILGILTVLMLDMGQSFAVFKVAFLGHWLGIFLLLARRPGFPTKTDIVFIRWGTPLLMMATGLIAPLVWKGIGKSDLSGWQRLWGHWAGN